MQHDLFFKDSEFWLSTVAAVQVEYSCVRPQDRFSVVKHRSQGNYCLWRASGPPRTLAFSLCARMPHSHACCRSSESSNFCFWESASKKRPQIDGNFRKANIKFDLWQTWWAFVCLFILSFLDLFNFPSHNNDKSHYFFLKIVKVFAQLVWLCAEFKTQKRKKTKGIKYKKASVSQKSVGVLHIFCLNIQCDQQTHSQTSSPSTTTPLCPMGPTQNSGERSPEPKSRKSQLCSSPFRHVWDCEYMFLCLLSASVCVYVCVSALLSRTVYLSSWTFYSHCFTGEVSSTVKWGSERERNLGL